MSSNDQHNLKHRWRMKLSLDQLIIWCISSGSTVTTRDVESEVKKKQEREHGFSSSYGLAPNVSLQVLILMLRRLQLVLE